MPAWGPAPAMTFSRISVSGVGLGSVGQAWTARGPPSRHNRGEFGTRDRSWQVRKGLVHTLEPWRESPRSSTAVRRETIVREPGERVPVGVGTRLLKAVVGRLPGRRPHFRRVTS